MELFPWDRLSEGDLRDSDLAESVGGLGQLGHPHDDRAGLGRGELEGGGALGEGPLRQERAALRVLGTGGADLDVSAVAGA